MVSVLRRSYEISLSLNGFNPNLELSPCLQFGFMFIALIWEFDFAPFMVLIIAILNDGEVTL